MPSFLETHFWDQFSTLLLLHNYLHLCKLSIVCFCPLFAQVQITENGYSSRDQINTLKYTETFLQHAVCVPRTPQTKEKSKCAYINKRKHKSENEYAKISIKEKNFQPKETATVENIEMWKSEIKLIQVEAPIGFTGLFILTQTSPSDCLLSL